MARRYTITALFLSVLSMLSTSAWAYDPQKALVDANMYPGTSTDVWFTFNGTQYGDMHGGISAGEFDLRLDFKPLTGNYDHVYDWNTDAYCVDLYQGAQLDHPYEADLLTLDTEGLKRAAWIMDNYSGSGNAIQNAAVQVAIWEVITDSDLNLDDGNFIYSWWSSAEVKTKAQSYLDALPSMVNLDDLANYYRVAHHGDYQDLLVTIPLPASVWLFGSALAGLVGFGKRRKS